MEWSEGWPSLSGPLLSLTSWKLKLFLSTSDKVNRPSWYRSLRVKVQQTGSWVRCTGALDKSMSIINCWVQTPPLVRGVEFCAHFSLSHACSVTPSFLSSTSLFLFLGFSLFSDQTLTVWRQTEVKWGLTSCQPQWNVVLITSTTRPLGCSLQSRFPDLCWRAWSSRWILRNVPWWYCKGRKCLSHLNYRHQFLPISHSVNLQFLISLISFPFSVSSSVSPMSLWLLSSPLSISSSCAVITIFFCI